MSPTNDNVVRFPDQGSRSSAKRRASADIQTRFRAGHGVSKEIYEHLARKVFLALGALRARVGERSGAMQRAFGENFLKQKKRFTLSPEEPVRAVCQNAGNWLQVLSGLARELGEDPDEFILDVFTGTALLPNRSSGDYRAEKWFGVFERLLEQMGGTLGDKADLLSVAQYLFDSALVLQGEELVEIEHQDEDPFVDERLEYHSQILGQIPHVLGINFRNDYPLPVELSDPAIAHLVASMREQEELPAEGFLIPDSGTRFGLAYAIDASSLQPGLALFEWRVAKLEVKSADGEQVISRPLMQNWEDLVNPESQDGGERLTPGWVRFGFLGSERFQRLAMMQIIFPDIWWDDEENEMWDVGGYVHQSADYPTNAPARTAAAAIERNLLYAAQEGQTAQRLDVLLGNQLLAMERIISSHRAQQKTTVDAALSTLMSEWQVPTLDGNSK